MLSFIFMFHLQRGDGYFYHVPCAKLCATYTTNVSKTNIQSICSKQYIAILNINNEHARKSKFNNPTYLDFFVTISLSLCAKLEHIEGARPDRLVFC